MSGFATRAGVTGSRGALPLAQTQAFAITLLRAYFDAADRFELHHGCCTGADELAHAVICGLPLARLVGHPGLDEHGESPHRMPEAAMRTLSAEYAPAPYRLRNREIAAAVSQLFAAPRYFENDPRSKRSGTWQTVRLARSLGRPITYVWPDGQVTADKGAALDQAA